MKVQGRLRISRPQGGGDERIHVELRDMLAGVAFAVAEIPLEEFARCLTGTAEECRIELRDLDLVGTAREHTRFVVHVPRLNDPDKQARAVGIAVGVHEHDGWRGRLLDATNHHNRCPANDSTGKDGQWWDAYWVSYERHVVRSSDDEPCLVCGGVGYQAMPHLGITAHRACPRCQGRS